MKRFSPSRTIRGKLLLLAVAIETIMLTILLANSLRLLSNAMSSQAVLLANQLYPVIKAAITAPLAQKDYATIQAIINESRTAGGVEYIVIEDSSGKRVASIGWENDSPLPVAGENIIILGRHLAPRYDVKSQVDYFGQDLGTIHFGLNLSNIIEARTSLLRQSLIIAVMEILLSTVILLFLGYWLTRHLTILTEASIKVASGDFSPQKVPEGTDDIGKLGVAFNLMSKAIFDRVEELTAAKEAAEASERAKSENEEQLKLVLDGSNDGFWDWDITTGKVNFSKRWAEMLGYGLDEIEPHVSAWEKLVHPEDMPFILKALEDHLQGKTSYYETEHRVRSKSGEWRWILDRGKVVKKDSDGRPIRAAGTHSDISKRKHAEETLKKNEEQIRLLLNSTAEAIYGMDLNGNCTFANQSCLRVLGITDQTRILGKNMHELIHHSLEDRSPLPMSSCEIYKAIKMNAGVHIDNEVFWRADGTSFPVEYWSYPQLTDGKVTGAVVTFYDITEKKIAELNLKKANEEMTASLAELTVRNREIAMLVEMSTILQTCRDLDESYDIMDTLLPQLFSPLSGAVYIKNSLGDLLEPVSSWGSEDLALQTFSHDDCWGLRRGKPHLTDDSGFTLKCPHTSHNHGFQNLCVPLSARGEVLGVLHLEHGDGIQENMLQLSRATADMIVLSLANLKLRDSLHEQSIRDPLTGLFNRRFMEESLAREISRAIRSKRPLSVMMLDIDHFKRFNDIHGHDSGDAVLRSTGKLLKKWIRSDDIACRYGGEEFTIIMPEAPMEIAVSRAEILRKNCSEMTIKHSGKELEHVTISVGISTLTDQSPDKDDILKHADEALYKAKQEGRNRIVTM